MLVSSQRLQIRKLPVGLVLVYAHHPFFHHRLTSVLISRFLLNLQDVDQKSTGMVSSVGSRVESAVFQQVIGSLGGDIEFGWDADLDGQDGGIAAESGGIGGIETNSVYVMEATEGSAEGN